MRTAVPGSFCVTTLVASSPSIPGMRTSMMMTFGRRRSAIAIALAPSDASPMTRTWAERESERRRPSLTTSWSSAMRQVISSGMRLQTLYRVSGRGALVFPRDDRTAALARELAGTLVDPVDGAYPGVVVIEGASIESVRADDDAPTDVLVFPGFVDLQVYDDRAIV